jgi:hypothetical protein
VPQDSKFNYQSKSHSKLSDLPYEIRKAIKPSLERAYDASQNFGSSGYVVNGSFYSTFEDIPVEIINSEEISVYECDLISEDFFIREVSAEEIRIHPSWLALAQSERTKLKLRLDPTNSKLFLYLIATFILLAVTYLVLKFS